MIELERRPISKPIFLFHSFLWEWKDGRKMVAEGQCRSPPKSNNQITFLLSWREKWNLIWLIEGRSGALCWWWVCFLWAARLWAVAPPALRGREANANKPTHQREGMEWLRKKGNWFDELDWKGSEEKQARHDERTQWSRREAKPASGMAPAQQIKEWIKYVLSRLLNMYLI